MTIVVQIDSSNAIHNLTRDFNYRCFTFLAEKYPSVSFVFVSDTPLLKQLKPSQNITYLSIGPRISNSLSKYYWYQYKLSKTLKKLNATYFFSSTNHCNNKNNAVQIIYLDALLSSRNRNNKALLKASHVIVPNDYIKKNVLQLMPSISEKLLICNTGIEKKDEYSIEFKENIKQKYTDDKDFFFFDFDKTNEEKLIVVLKAFSLFKKWQHSKMKLLIVADSNKIESVEKVCSNYKYKEDVVIVSNQNEETLYWIIGSSYATIFIPIENQLPFNVLTALSYKLPVILPATAFYKASFGDAILYTEENETAISNNLMLLYKDEKTRKEFVNKSKALSAARTWENCANYLWESIINKKKI